MQSQAVLNIHAQGDNRDADLEIARLTLYLSNALFVVSEQGTEPDQTAMLQQGVVFVPDNQTRMTPDVVSPYLGEDMAEKRREIGRKGQAIMRGEWACLTRAESLGALDRIAGVGFPSWFVESFYKRSEEASRFAGDSKEKLLGQRV